MRNERENACLLWCVRIWRESSKPSHSHTLRRTAPVSLCASHRGIHLKSMPPSKSCLKRSHCAEPASTPSKRRSVSINDGANELRLVAYYGRPQVSPELARACFYTQDDFVAFEADASRKPRKRAGAARRRAQVTNALQQGYADLDDTSSDRGRSASVFDYDFYSDEDDAALENEPVQTRAVQQNDHGPSKAVVQDARCDQQHQPPKGANPRAAAPDALAIAVAAAADYRTTGLSLRGADVNTVATAAGAPPSQQPARPLPSAAARLPMPPQRLPAPPQQQPPPAPAQQRAVPRHQEPAQWLQPTPLQQPPPPSAALAPIVPIDDAAVSRPRRDARLLTEIHSSRRLGSSNPVRPTRFRQGCLLEAIAPRSSHMPHGACAYASSFRHSVPRSEHRAAQAEDPAGGAHAAGATSSCVQVNERRGELCTSLLWTRVARGLEGCVPGGFDLTRRSSDGAA